jgi:predicted DCC family thiol-disulfide oxidoreductase YuxK
VALGTEEARMLLRGMSEDVQMASWHLLEPAGVHSAGAAFPPVFARLPGGRPLALASARFPGASERLYRWVADHRTPLGRALPAATRRWADGVISGSRPDGR